MIDVEVKCVLPWCFFVAIVTLTETGSIVSTAWQPMTRGVIWKKDIFQNSSRRFGKEREECLSREGTSKASPLLLATSHRLPRVVWSIQDRNSAEPKLTKAANCKWFWRQRSEMAWGRSGYPDWARTSSPRDPHPAL